MSGAALLCFDLRAVGDLESAWIAQAALVLQHARGMNWAVAHALSAPLRVSVAPLAFTPRAREPVFAFAGANALECGAARDWCAAPRTRVYLIGMAFSRAGLASATAAYEADAPFVLIVDACAPASDPRAALTLLSTPIVRRVAADSILNEADARVVDLSRYRRGRGGQGGGGGESWRT